VTVFPLKRISASGVPAALQKAERYRLLNDSSAAESICRDIVEVEPDNQQALIVLLLAITDQFADDLGDSVRRAREVLPRLRDEYKRAYYAGIICERRAKAQRRQSIPGSGSMAYESFREAMDWYEKAEGMRPEGNDEAILRWNTCARLLASDDHLRPRPAEQYEPVLED
jgi:tetratricopeptide (TPR) repeat protein